MNKSDLDLIVQDEMNGILKSFVDKKYNDGTIYHIISNLFLHCVGEMYEHIPESRSLMRDSIRKVYILLTEELDEIDDLEDKE